MYKVLRQLDIASLCLFLGPLKTGLLWLSVNVSFCSLVLCSASLFLGIVLLWVSDQINLVLFASGSCQFLIFILLGPTLFPLYYSIYLLALLGIS